MCERIQFGDGSSAIVCGIRTRRRKCRFCSSQAEKLCDFDVGAGKTCDAPLCPFHAHSAGADRDFCPQHSRLSAMNVKLPATRIALLEAGWVQLESRACRLCGSQIEFWRAPNCAKHPLEVRPADDWKLGTHFETCPKASEFRKPKTTSPQENKQGDLFK